MQSQAASSVNPEGQALARVQAGPGWEENFAW